MKLECLAQYTLNGNIMSLQAVSLVGSPRDSLIVSFREAKLAILEYDLETHDLSVLSLHQFEEAEMKVRVYLGNYNFKNNLNVRLCSCQSNNATMLLSGH